MGNKQRPSPKKTGEFFPDFGLPSRVGDIPYDIPNIINTIPTSYCIFKIYIYIYIYIYTYIYIYIRYMWGLIIKGSRHPFPTGEPPGGSSLFPLENSEVLERFRGELGEDVWGLPIHPFFSGKIGENE